MILLWCKFIAHLVLTIFLVISNWIKGILYVCSDAPLKRRFEFLEDQLNAELVKLGHHLV